MLVSERYRCPCCGVSKIDEELVCLIKAIEHTHNIKLVINSSYRCDKHNQEVGGVSFSTHTKGTACDFTAGHGILDMLHETLKNHNGGYKYYKDKNFIHIDVDRKRRW